MMSEWEVRKNKQNILLLLSLLTKRRKRRGRRVLRKGLVGTQI